MYSKPTFLSRTMGTVTAVTGGASFPIVAALALMAAGFMAFAVYLGWHETIDDAAITFAYSQNLVRGHGLVLNPGAEPVEGYTTFLWMLFMAPFIALGLDAVVVSKIAGLTLAVGTIGLVARLPGIALQRRPSWTDLLAPALLVVALPFALWSVSGMENGLQAFLLVLAVALTFREINKPSALPLSSAAFVALALTRPEGVAYWLVAVAHRVLLWILGRRTWKDLLWVGAFLLPFGIYHLWHFLYFGEVVPNTYFAKASHRALTDLIAYATNPYDPGFGYVHSFFSTYWLLPSFSVGSIATESENGLTRYGLLLLAPLLGLSLLGPRGLTHYSLPLMLLLAGVAYVLYSGGDWMRFHRFMSPLLPLLYLIVQESVRTGAFGLDGLLRYRLPRLRRSWAGAAASALLGILVLGSTAGASLEKTEEVRERPFGAEFSVVEARAEVVQRLAACTGNRYATVLTPDIGAVAYTTDLFIIDKAGLADRFIARHPYGPAFLDYVFEDRQPDIIATHEVWFKDIDLDPRLKEQYVLVMDEWEEGYGRSLTVYLREDHFRSSPECVAMVSRIDFVAGDN